MIPFGLRVAITDSIQGAVVDFLIAPRHIPFGNAVDCHTRANRIEPPIGQRWDKRLYCSAATEQDRNHPEQSLDNLRVRARVAGGDAGAQYNLWFICGTR